MPEQVNACLLYYIAAKQSQNILILLQNRTICFTLLLTPAQNQNNFVLQLHQ